MRRKRQGVCLFTSLQPARGRTSDLSVGQPISLVTSTAPLIPISKAGPRPTGTRKTAQTAETSGHKAQSVQFRTNNRDETRGRAHPNSSEGRPGRSEDSSTHPPPLTPHTHTHDKQCKKQPLLDLNGARRATAPTVDPLRSSQTVEKRCFQAPTARKTRGSVQCFILDFTRS